MTEKSPNLVYIVDDDHGIRASLGALLASVGIAFRAFHSAEESLSAIHSESPSPACMLVDVRMPGMSGLELQQELAKRKPELPLVMITGHGDVGMAVQAMKFGAFDFLEKPFNEQQLIDTVNKCLKYGQDANAQRLYQQQAKLRLDQLSRREREVLRLLVAGNSSKQIAQILGLSTKTVDVHRHHIMNKTGVRSVAELVRMTMDADDAISS